MQFHALDGLFYRIVPATRAAQALAPAISPEGRFHHDAQPTLYVSPRPDWAEHAIKAYVQPDDTPRLICELNIAAAKVLDLRDPAQCAEGEVDPMLAGVPWLPERALNRHASTWRLSDRAREMGADGMIYTARTTPSRWHLVLFNWAGAHLTGNVQPYPLSGLQQA